VEGGSVFVLSSYLKLYRLNATNGTVTWLKDLRSLYGGTVISWQNAASPVLEGGLIFLNANCANSNLMALRTSDGSLAWRSQNEPLTHSTPVLATILGVRQVIFASQTGLVSLDPGSGNLLWKFPYPFIFSTALGASPVVCEDMVFISGFYSMGSVVMQASLTNNAWKTTQLWFTNTYASNLGSHWMTPVAHQGFLYGQFGFQQFDATTNTQLKCIEMRTGIVKWSTNGFGHGATIMAGDSLLTITETGGLVLQRPNTNSYDEVARFQAIPYYNGTTNKCWNGPAVADGHVYVRSTSYAAAFDFSMPALKLDAPQLVAPDKLQLTVRTVDGTPLASNRLAGMAVRAGTNLAQGLSEWVPLTNSLLLTNGAVRIDGVDSRTQPREFFILSEPQ